MIVGIPPFYSDDVQTMYKNILKEDLVIPEVLSEEAQDIIARLLEKNPENRLGSGIKGFLIFF
jgi:serine/threonine protein kinase